MREKQSVKELEPYVVNPVVCSIKLDANEGNKDLYKDLIKKISSDFNRQNNFKKVEKCFLDFTKNLWIQEITDDETGSMLCKMWEEDLNIQDIFLKLKNKYDILYKRYNIEETSNKNGRLGIAMVIVIVICVINLVLLLGRVV